MFSSQFLWDWLLRHGAFSAISTARPLALGHQYDLGKPNTRSAMKLKMSCGLMGAMRGIRLSRK